jgi:protein-disulfide isomerase
MRVLLPSLIVAIVGLLTIGAGAMLYRTHRPVTVTITDRNGPGGEPSVTHIRGPADAPVTIEEFGDFQCPPCGMLSGPLKEMEDEHKNNLKVIFRHLPFPVHAHAFEAACAAEAADLQGKFWEMHDLLYREQPNWSAASNARQVFASYAGMLGLEVDRFAKDMDSPEVKSRVEQDKKRASSLGINTTPSLFINNRSVPPDSLKPDILRKVVDDIVKNSGKPKDH